MNIEQLKYFTTVARCENVSQAAADLYMTQPSLSRSLGRLEGELGVKLFERRRGKLTLSPEGRRFLPYAEDALRALNEGLGVLASTARSQELVIGSLVEGLLGSMLPDFATAHPELSIRQASIDTLHVVPALRGNAIDLVLTSSAVRAQGITFKVLGSVSCCIFTGVDSPWANRPEVTLGQLAHADFICDSTRLGHAELKRYCREAGFEPHIICEVEDINVVHAMLVSNDAVAIMPAPQLERLQALGLAEDIVCIPFAQGEPAPIFTLGAAFDNTRTLGKPEQALCDHISSRLAADTC